MKKAQCLTGVSEFYGYGDGVYRDVSGAEFGSVVVAVFAELRGDPAGFVEVFMRLAAVVVTGGGDGKDRLSYWPIPLHAIAHQLCAMTTLGMCPSLRVGTRLDVRCCANAFLSGSASENP
jgi:hypothetical protein